MAEASLWDGVLIVGGTVLVWRLVLKPFVAWLEKPGSFRGIKVVPSRKDPPVWDEVGVGFEDPDV